MDQIDKYLMGNLHGDDLNSFLSQVKGDIKLKEELEARYHIFLAANETAVQDKFKMLSHYEKVNYSSNEDGNNATSANEKTDNTKQDKVFKIGSSKIMGLAASLLLMIGAGWYLLNANNSLDQKYATYFEPYPSNVTITRSATTDMDKLTLSAHGQYQNGNYEQAGPLFEELYKRDLDTMALFYAGISYVGAKDLKNAKRIFNNPINWNVNKLYLDKLNKILE